jgi:hypothetical protein
MPVPVAEAWFWRTAKALVKPGMGYIIGCAPTEVEKLGQQR